MFRMSILLRPVLLKVWALLYAVSLTPLPLDISLTASSFFVGNWPPRFLVHAQWTPLPSPVETSLRPITLRLSRISPLARNSRTSIPVPLLEQDPMKRSSLTMESSSQMACRVHFLSYTCILTSGAANFRKVLKLAPTSGLRAVAINRQDYPHAFVLPCWTRNDGHRIRHRQSYIFVKPET